MKWFTFTLLIAMALSTSFMPVLGGPLPKRRQSPNQEPGELLHEGDVFCSQGQLPSALSAYLRAAKAGNMIGAFAAGDMLFKQGQASSGRERIMQLSEGLKNLFLAATHGNARACAELSSALDNGIGVKTNLNCAYAWLELATEWDPSFKPDLDRLVVQLAADDVQQAQALAAAYANGHWPTDLVHPVDQGDSRLRIQGITSNGRKSLVIINNASLAAGDSAMVQPANNPHPSVKNQLSITCLEIGADYALVSIAGESHFKLLSGQSMP